MKIQASLPVFAKPLPPPFRFSRALMDVSAAQLHIHSDQRLAATRPVPDREHVANARVFRTVLAVAIHAEIHGTRSSRIKVQNVIALLNARLEVLYEVHLLFEDAHEVT